MARPSPVILSTWPRRIFMRKKSSVYCLPKFFFRPTFANSVSIEIPRSDMPIIASALIAEASLVQKQASGALFALSKANASVSPGPSVSRNQGANMVCTVASSSAVAVSSLMCPFATSSRTPIGLRMRLAVLEYRASVLMTVAGESTHSVLSIVAICLICGLQLQH